jgi:hypothetical protein
MNPKKLKHKKDPQNPFQINYIFEPGVSKYGI